MKKTILVTTLVIVSIFLYVGCRKYDENLMPKGNNGNEEAPAVLGNINGKVILPVNSTVNVNSLDVVSPIDSSIIAGSTFNLKAYTSEFSTLLVSNGSGDIILMGYDYPEKADRNITVSSTALAFVMNTPIVLSLSKEGKLALIQRIKADANFQNLENEIEAQVLANKNLFDSTNTTLFQSIETLLSSASNKKSRSINDAVLFQQLEPKDNFKFYNDGSRVISTVVGVYKNGQRINDHEIVVDGINFMPTSIQDITSLNFAAASAPPDPIYYTLTGNGDYAFKARTGRPDSYENSVDFKNAFLLNIQNLSVGLLEPFLPNLKKNNVHCFVKLSQDVYDLYQLNNYNIYELTFEVIRQTLSNAKDIEICMNGNANLFNSSYFSKMSKYFERLDLLFLPGSAFNQTLFGIQWSTIHPSLDKCFYKSNDTILPCDSYIAASAKFNGVESLGATSYSYVYNSTTNELNFEIMMTGFGMLRLQFPDAVGLYANKTMQLDAFQIGTYTSLSNTIEVISESSTNIKGRFNGVLVGPNNINVTDGIFNIQRTK